MQLVWPKHLSIFCANKIVRKRDEEHKTEHISLTLQHSPQFWLSLHFASMCRVCKTDNFFSRKYIYNSNVIIIYSVSEDAKWHVSGMHLMCLMLLCVHCAPNVSCCFIIFPMLFLLLFRFAFHSLPLVPILHLALYLFAFSFQFQCFLLDAIS